MTWLVLPACGEASRNVADVHFDVVCFIRKRKNNKHRAPCVCYCLAALQKRSANLFHRRRRRPRSTPIRPRILPSRTVVVVILSTNTENYYFVLHRGLSLLLFCPPIQRIISLSSIADCCCCYFVPNTTILLELAQL